MSTVNVAATASGRVALAVAGGRVAARARDARHLWRELLSMVWAQLQHAKLRPEARCR